ncbi:hypothetical protein GLAREA_01788 [Glarea lozoyensis ATCC 20868]|uniref:Uncharacterized protein n=1 Tax=Glarea lozoyensis (strain ATCC 20868 / MF5171) TaxID=1116229 RepID=S3D1H9_GLAL2|nr:uncharacterized protein GLAREA_01788 [Glarea lozoyensis ATCC 20868]EPE25876.1 hypothetical protein GLAREA_01788 [Glarea lozoyensis ATCC 20868]
MTGYTAEVLLTVVAVIGLIFCFVTGPWVYRLWTTRSLYLKDFEKLSAQARKLNNKTTEIIEAVARDSTAADCIQLTNKELVNTAAEWDNGIRTALVAWEDFIEMQRCRNKEPVVDIEKQKRKNAIHLAKQRRKHAKFMIKFMRAKVLEGISQREDLNAQLQRIHMAVKTRSNRWEAERANQYLKDDLEIQFAKNVVPSDSSSVRSSSTYCSAEETPSFSPVDVIEPVEQRMHLSSNSFGVQPTIQGKAQAGK